MRNGPCCQTLIELTLCCCNTLVFVVSFSVLVGAGWLLVQPDAGAYLPDQLTQPLAPVLYDLRGEVSLLPVLLFLAAVLAILLISFLGCVGTCLRNRCMIAVYFLLVLSLLVALATLAALTLTGDRRQIVEAVLNSSLPLYNNTASVQPLWDTLQHRLECCGVNSYTDWRVFDLNTTVMEVDCFIPFSCDESLSLNATQVPAQSSFLCLEDITVFEQGCVSAVTSLLSTAELHPATMIALVSLGALLVINVLFSLSLCVVIDYAEYFYKY